MELSNEIKEARRRLNLTQEQAASAWNVPLKTLRHWEQGRHQPRSFGLIHLRQILDAALADKPVGPASSESPAPSPAPPKELRRRRPTKQLPRRAKATTARRKSRD